MKTSETRNNSDSGQREREREKEKKAPVVWIVLPKSAFNGENLHGVSHHFKVWLHEVCPSGVSAVEIMIIIIIKIICLM